MERPYRAIGYPIVPAIFIVAVVAFVINALIHEPVSTGLTFALILLGIPVYRFAFARRRAPAR
jgi:APA family basic amino acid/polyamine antiporter